MAWIEKAGIDKTSKMERFDYFCRALHLGCFICSATSLYVFIHFVHVVFSGVIITGTSEMDSSAMPLEKDSALALALFEMRH